MTRRDIPNLLTTLRILLVVPVIWLLLQREFGAAVTLFFLAGASDGLDGYLAKTYGWGSRLGAILDPLADKALLMGSFLTLGWLGLIPSWLVITVVVRDLVIVAGALVYHFKVQQLEASPSLISKINTAAQILLVSVVIISAGPWPMAAWITATLVWITLVTTLISGVNYVWVWSRKAFRKGWLR